MTPDVVLLADASPEIGWGHAVRQLALAEALVAKGTKPLFVTRTKDALKLDWPCRVGLLGNVRDLDTHNRVVCDLPDGQGIPAASIVFDDHGHGGQPGSAIVDPHFGAVDRHNAPWGSFLGPRWAPLRAPFYWRHRPIRDVSGVFTYGPHPVLPKGLEATSVMGLDAQRVAWTMMECAVALVPPSMVALECLAIGTPVVLYVPEPKYQPIADAMVEAGVAEIWSGAADDYMLARVLSDDGLRKRMRDAGHSHVDGRGAERLAEWLR